MNVYASVKVADKNWSCHHAKIGKQEVYDILSDYVGTEEAIEADSWSELATVGEVYEGSYFIVEIVEV